MLVRVERLAHAVQLVVQLTVEFVVPRGPVGYAGLEFLQRKHIFHLGNPFVEIANVEFPVIYRLIKSAELGCCESFREKVEQGCGLRRHVLPHEPQCFTDNQVVVESQGAERINVHPTSFVAVGQTGKFLVDCYHRQVGDGDDAFHFLV